MKIREKVKNKTLKLYDYFLKKHEKKKNINEINFDTLVYENVNQLNLEDKKKEELRKKWTKILKENAKKFGKYSVGNKVEIYNDGFIAFNDIIKSINNSKKRVWFEVYIFDDSILANKIVDSLCNAAKRGCDVILLVDYVGSLKIKNSWIKKLKENNVNVIFFNNLKNSYINMVPFFFRNHRKIMIIDDHAYCGSMNVSQNVVSDNEFLNKSNENKILKYYDLIVKLKGPSVKHLADVFLDSLKESKANIYRDSIEDQIIYTGQNTCYVQILESNIPKNVKSIQLTFDKFIRNATNDIYVTTSYFLPPGFLKRAILYALSNNVHISFLLSGKSDIFGDVIATYYIIQKILKKCKKNNEHVNKDIYQYFNVYLNNYDKLKKKKFIGKFYFLQNKHCHAKNIVVDNLWTSIGSYNWDRYSSRRNLEVMVSVFNKNIADQFIKEHKNQINNSVQITWEYIKNRNFLQILISNIFYHIGKISGTNLFDGLSNNNQNNILKKTIIHKYLIDNCIKNISLKMMWGT